jgi:hypothetical protein
MPPQIGGSHPSVVDRRTDARRRGPEPALEQHPEPHTPSLGRGDHPPGLLDSQGDRLLAEHMPAATRRCDHAGLVLGVRGADGHRVEAGVQHLFQIAEGPFDAVLPGERASPPCIDIGDRGHPHPVHTA